MTSQRTILQSVLLVPASLFFAAGALLTTTNCTKQNGQSLVFSRVPRPSGTAFQANADGTLGEMSKGYAFSLDRAIDVSISLDVTADRPDFSASLIKERFFLGKTIPCAFEPGKPVCHLILKRGEPGHYTILIEKKQNTKDDTPIRYELFASVQGPGYADFADQKRGTQR